MMMILLEAGPLCAGGDIALSPGACRAEGWSWFAEDRAGAPPLMDRVGPADSVVQHSNLLLHPRFLEDVRQMVVIAPDQVLQIFLHGFLPVAGAKSPVQQDGVVFQLSEELPDVDGLGPGYRDQHHGHQQVPHQEENRKDDLADPVSLTDPNIEMSYLTRVQAFRDVVGVIAWHNIL